jgi:hypothetical protein
MKYVDKISKVFETVLNDLWMFADIISNDFDVFDVCSSNIKTNLSVTQTKNIFYH